MDPAPINMFDLDQAIAQWRRQLTAEGVSSPDVLDELENHLREDVQQQMTAGLSARQAFEAAVREMGDASSLKAEFSKLRITGKSAPSKFLRIFCFLSAPLVMA